jgi:hypothetical protein
MSVEEQSSEATERYCPDCGRQIPVDAVACPHCKSNFDTSSATEWFERIREHTEPKLGVFFGTLAFAIGYFLVYALILVDSEANLEQVMSQFGTDSFTAVGWVFYGAHFVPLEVAASSQLQTVNILSISTLAIPKFVYFAVPLIVLLGSGYLVGRLAGAKATTLDSALAGGSVVAAYLPLAIVGAFVFVTTRQYQNEFGNTVTVVYAPVTTTTVGIGLLLPLVVGGIGGYLAHTAATE